MQSEKDIISNKYRLKLNKFHKFLKDQILKYQHPISGLFPLYPDDPDCKISHVRDSVYCASSAWALYQCYQKIDDDEGRTYELGQCAVKCMRTILIGWMQQCDRIEMFKLNQSHENCLFSILDYETGEPQAPESFHHLQMDCVGLFILQLVQMISSGLQVIYTKTEVAFIQNLVFYLERSYRISDYGMWERGTKQNKNITELHSSSIGMAQAALEAISGCNMFGREGDHSTVIFVDIDAHSRNRIIMTNLLPRESASKGADSALIPTLSWPAFATHSDHLREISLERVIKRFEGHYGFKRFSRDGYRTVLEEREIYCTGELKKFENIENEWPMFFAYMVIESCFMRNMEEAKSYNNKLTPLLHKVAGEKYMWLPKFYSVTRDHIKQEKANPGSTKRESSINLDEFPKFLWGQAVYLISQLMLNDCLLPHDLDPLTRHIPAEHRAITQSLRYSTLMGKPLNLVIQVVLISESVRLQQMLATYGIQTQTPHQVEPIQIWPPDQLVRVGQFMGCSKKLGLTGRPSRPIGQLGTSKFYRISGVTIICYPLLFEVQDFYLLHDMNVVIEECKHDFAFLSNWWRLKGRPTFCMLIKEDMIKSPDADALISFLSLMKTGRVDGTRVMLGRAQNFVASSCVEHLDFVQNCDQLSDFTRVQQLDVGRSFRSLTDIAHITKSDSECDSKYDQAYIEKMSTDQLNNLALHSDSLYKQSQLLWILMKRHGLDHVVSQEEKATVRDKLTLICRKAGIQQNWYVVRLCSALLKKFVNSLAPSISAILVTGKQVTIGVANKPGETTLDKPMNPSELHKLLLDVVFKHDPVQVVLQQELILIVSNLLTKNKSIFNGIALIRMGWLVEAMKLVLKNEKQSPSALYAMSPTDIKTALENTLLYGTSAFTGNVSALMTRQINGCLCRVPELFYQSVYKILARSPKGIIIHHEKLDQEPTLQDMTHTDLNFVNQVEFLLQPIEDPAYRSILVEAIMVTSIILDRNQELQFNDVVDVRRVIQDAMREFKMDRSENQRDDLSVEEIQRQFFSTEPNIRLGTTSYLAKVAINYLLQSDINLDYIDKNACSIS